MFLLDTNVVSELRKVQAGKADAQVAAWAKTVNSSALFISVITVEELEIGVLLAERRDAQKGRVLRDWLDLHVIPGFADRILPVGVQIAQRCAGLHVPNPHAINDALIAATALVHRMTVVTRNVDDFASTGATTLNPWSV